MAIADRNKSNARAKCKGRSLCIQIWGTVPKSESTGFAPTGYLQDPKWVLQGLSHELNHCVADIIYF
jgi:hypothetical protein